MTSVGKRKESVGLKGINVGCMCAAGAGRVQGRLGAVSFLVCVQWWLHWFRGGFDVAVNYFGESNLQIARGLIMLGSRWEWVADGATMF